MEASEELHNLETLKRMIRAGTAENYGPRGRYCTNEDLSWILEYVDKRTEIANQSIAEDERSRMIFVPMNSLPESILEKVEVKNQPDNIAICFAYQGRKTDRFGRSGPLAGLAIMSQEDAQRIQNGILEDPRLLFSLARAVNSGPIKRYDGQPVELIAGKDVTLLSNAQFEGEISEPIQSKPFPENFDPNPL